MRVVVTGGTGYIGRALVSKLAARGDDVVILSRSPAPPRGGVQTVVWTGQSDGEWTRSLDGARAVVHLAGASIAGKRWSKAYKEDLRQSRIESARSLVDAIGRASSRPRVLVSQSAVGYYGSRGDEELTESSPPGDDFLARLCADWEAAATGAEAHGVRVVLNRAGVVLGPSPGGALAEMARPFKMFVGGPIADGRQWMSLVQLEDEVGLLLHAIDRDDLRGPMNSVMPSPVRSAEFSKTLGRVLRRPSWIPVPKAALRVVIGEVANHLVASQRAMPKKALESGYEFRFPDVESALRASLRD